MNVLTIPIAGEDREVAVLPVRRSNEWKAAVAEVLASEKLRGLRISEAGDLGSLFVMAGDLILDLVCRYDHANALGGREYLLDNADDRELYGALVQMLRATFPWARDVRSAVASLATTTTNGAVAVAG